MNFFQAIGSVYKNYAGFSGYAKRSEYWYFNLFVAVIFVALLGIAGLTGLLGMIISAVMALFKGDFDSVSTAFGASLGLFLTMLVITGLFSIFTLLPFVALHCRRMRDAGLTWWMMILVFVAAIMMTAIPFVPIMAAPWIVCIFPSRATLLVPSDSESVFETDFSFAKQSNQSSPVIDSSNDPFS